MKKRNNLMTSLAVLFVSCASASVSGQTTVPANNTTSTTAPADQTEEIVKLSAFEVRDSRDKGYFASQSISGMKTQAGLMDTPGNIAVIPRDLINDIYEPTSAGLVLQFVASGTNLYRNGEQIQVRGSRTGFTLVDDIPDIMYYADNTGIDSYEVLKGPTSLLYGPSAGIFGLIIKTTKKPLPEFQGNISASVGSFGYRRTDLDLTGPLGHGFSYRLIGAYQKYDGPWGAFWFDNRKVLIGTLQWTDGKTTIRGTYEHATIEYNDSTGFAICSQSDRAIYPWVSPLGQNFRYGPRFGFGGLYSNCARLTLIHKWSENWQTRVFYDKTYTDRPSVDAIGFASYDLNAKTFSLYYDDYDENFRSTEAGTDTIGKYNIAGVGLQTNLGFLYDNRDGTSIDYTYIPDFLDGSLVNPPNFASTTRPASSKNKPNDFSSVPSKTYYVLETIKPIPNSDRLIVNGGAARIRAGQSTGPVWDTVERAGIVFKPIDEVSVYAAYATRFTPTSSPTYVDINGARLPNIEGKGTEVGIKTDLFKHRLMITLDAYKLSQTNITQGAPTYSPITGRPYYIFIGDTVNKGVELDLRAQVTANWQLIVVGWNGSDLNSKGVELDHSMKKTAGFFTKYGFEKGALKGWSVGGGTYFAGTKYYMSSNRYIPAYQTTNLFIEYQYNRNWRGSLHIGNLFDKTYISGGSAPNGMAAAFGDPRRISLTLSYSM